MNPLLISIACGFVLSVGAYFFGRIDGSKLKEAEQQRIEERIRQSELAMQKAAAEAIAKIEVQNKTIRTEVQREIVEKPIYRDCVADPSILHSLNSAKGIKPSGDSVVPGTAPVN